MRRALVVLMVVAAAGSWPLAASPAPSSQAGKSAMVVDADLRADFNGDGAADLAIGVPGEDLGSGLTRAGGVQVLYGSADGLSGSGSQFFTQGSDGVPDTPEQQEFFGGVLAAGDFDGDGKADLAVGAPNEGVGDRGDAGVAIVLYGSASGLSGAGSQLFSQDSPGIPSIAESGDNFGGALTAGDFNGDGKVDLATGDRFGYAVE